MKALKKYMKHVMRFCFISFLILFSSFNKLSADEINWIDVAKTNNEIQSIDTNSLKYNNKGLLTFLTKYVEFNPEDQKIINTNSYLMAVDCENRLFSKLSSSSDANQVKNWKEPINNKLIKTTILNSCSY